MLEHDRGFSYTDAATVPQTDRLGRGRVWAVLGNPPLGRLDASESATSKWWLWLANIGPHGRAVLGKGAVALDLTQNNQTEKHLICTRADGSAIDSVVTPTCVQPSAALLAAEEAMG